jgi:hypothetical protein
MAFPPIEEVFLGGVSMETYAQASTATAGET